MIVVCLSSKHLFDAVCAAGGKPLKTSFYAAFDRKFTRPVISVRAEGQLKSKAVYFLPWKVASDDSILRQSIKSFVSNAVTTASSHGYRSIAFSAIGCGQLKCSASLVAQTMVEEAYNSSQKQNLSIVFVIQPPKADVYDEFQTQIRLRGDFNALCAPVKAISVPIHKGVIEVEMGDITKQKVYVQILLSYNLDHFSLPIG